MAIALAAVAFVGCDKGGEDDPTPGGGDGVVALATPAPTVDQASVTTNSFTVAWPAVQGAIGYLYSVNDGAPRALQSTQCRLLALRQILPTHSRCVPCRVIPLRTSTLTGALAP